MYNVLAKVGVDSMQMKCKFRVMSSSELAVMASSLKLMSRNLARQTSRDLHSNCFAMVLTAGFYCDSRAHNVRKVRVVKYIVVSG